jgi:hypothetical protein
MSDDSVFKSAPGAKTACILRCHFASKYDHFAKTGSGQTQGKITQRDRDVIFAGANSSLLYSTRASTPVRETPFELHQFNAKNDHFTKTGSGQR